MRICEPTETDQTRMDYSYIKSEKEMEDKGKLAEDKDRLAEDKGRLLEDKERLTEDKERLAVDEFQHFCDTVTKSANSKYVYTIGNNILYLIKLLNYTYTRQ